MKLTPLDVKKQEFRKTLRGFDPIEVQTFLEMVAEEYERVLEENKQLNNRLIELETKLKDYQETEKNLRETLLNVQEVKKQSEESSRRQADLLIKEAELKALEIVENARKQARQMRDEVNMLRTQKESFINRLRQILVSQIELLSVLEMDDAIPEEAQEYVESVRSQKKNVLKKRARQLESEMKKEQSKSKDAPRTVSDDEKEADSAGQETQEEPFSISSDFIEADAEAEKPQKKEADEKAPSAKKAREDVDEDINEFFKKGIQIDELIQNLDKKRKKK